MLEIILTLFGGILLGAGLFVAVALIAGKRMEKKRALRQGELHEAHAQLILRWKGEFERCDNLNHIDFQYSDTPDAGEEERWSLIVRRPGGKSPVQVNGELRNALRRTLNHIDFLMGYYHLELPPHIEEVWEYQRPRIQELAQGPTLKEDQPEEASTC